MITRLGHLYRRYAGTHFRVTRAGFDIRDPAGGLAGRVESCERRGDKLHLAGWARGARVLVESDLARREVTPAIWRQDVADMTGDRRAAGFEIALPVGAAPVRVTLDGGAGRGVPRFPRRRMLAAQLRTRLRFATALLGAAPAILLWSVTRSAQARASVKRRLGLEQDVARDVPRIRPAIFAAPQTGPRPDTWVTLVMPVFNAFEVLQDALERVRCNTDLPWRLILVEDASTDPRVRPWLRDFAAAPGGEVLLIENPANLGFVGAANRGLQAALYYDEPVVLLNSDAMVPRDWASRLLAPMLADPRVASVTPMSNDAEIFTVPLICRPGALRPGEADALDAAAARLDPVAAPVPAPTGVGFCMAMNMAFLRRIGGFDTAFGRGYGEEVDWCQKARAMGGVHLCQPALFVEHRGGESFGSADKLRLIAEHNAIIARRYPSYDAEVQAFIRTDPAGDARLALALALASLRQAGAMPAFIAHSLGGGAEMDLKRRIVGFTGSGSAAVVLRVGGASLVLVELHLPGGVARCDTEDWPLVLRLLEPVAPRRIIYSNGVGHPDPVTLPDQILSLQSGPEDRIEVLFHDYFPLSPSYCLLDAGGSYRGVPDVDDRDPAHTAHRPGGGIATLADWRAAWGRLLSAAGTLTVFSQGARAIVAQAYPQAADRIVLRPHEPMFAPGRAAAIPGGRPVVGVLGNIGWQKGLGVVAALGRSAEAAAGAFDLVVIGNTDPGHPLPARVRVHGSYDPNDLTQLIARHGITAWLIPSVWPETFCFTAHEALATGLPCHAFDLGGQGDAMRQQANGHRVPFDPDGSPAKALIAAWARDGVIGAAVPQHSVNPVSAGLPMPRLPQPGP